MRKLLYALANRLHRMRHSVSKVTVDDMVQAAHAALLGHENSTSLYSGDGLTVEGLRVVNRAMDREWRFGAWAWGEDKKYGVETLHVVSVSPFSPAERSPLMDLTPAEKDVVGAIVGHKQSSVAGISRRLGYDCSAIVPALSNLSGAIADAARLVPEKIQITKPPKRAQMRYHWRLRLLGVCRCGMPVAKGMAACDDCMMRNRKRCKEYRCRNLAAIRESEVVKYAAHVAAGLCAVCGKELPVSNRQTCERCLMRHREWARQYRERHRERVNRMARERRKK